MASERPTPVTLPEGIPTSGEYRRGALADILRERTRQDVRWGVSRNLHPQLWLAVLAEEMGEVAQAILKGERDNYRTELVQVAAVALAAIQDWDWQAVYREKLPPPQVVAFGWQRSEQGDRDGNT